MTNGILCLESLWSNDTGSNRASVAPLVEYVSRSFDVKHTVFDCGTAAELQLRLKKSRKSGFKILYFSGHGQKGKFETDAGAVGLPEIAKMMNSRFEGWYVHFGSCLVLNVNVKEAKSFKRETGIRQLSGYRKSVDWTMSSAFDLVWLSHLVSGEKLDYVTFGHLIRSLGFAYL